MVVALTHAIYTKLTPPLRARRKNESHAIAKTHTTNQQITLCTAHSAHPLTSSNLDKNQTLSVVKHQKKQSDSHATNSKSHCARLIQHTHWHHQVLAKPCPHCVEHTENSFQLSHQRQQITVCTAHSAHQPLTSPSLNQTMRTLWRTPRKFMPTITPTTANHTVHGSFSTPATDITKS